MGSNRLNSTNKTLKKKKCQTMKSADVLEARRRKGKCAECEAAIFYSHFSECKHLEIL